MKAPRIQQEAIQPEAPVINISGLCKSFGANQVLHGIDLTLEPGHIVGLIGPNSGGKSTLLRHLPGIYLPTEGHCRVFGTEAGRLTDADMARIGYVHQEAELMEWMTTERIIRYVAAHYSTWNHDMERQLIRSFELDPDETVAVMSPGQRQKLSILLAVCFEPDLLILDEPASALDPIARRNFLELLLSIIQNQHRTILISSHILSDIEKVIDHVLIMNRGELIRDCTFDELLEEFVRLEVTALDGALPDRSLFGTVLAWEQDAGQAVAIVKARQIDADALSAHTRCRIVSRPLSLEEIYPLVLQEYEAAHPGLEPYRGVLR